MLWSFCKILRREEAPLYSCQRSGLFPRSSSAISAAWQGKTSCDVKRACSSLAGFKCLAMSSSRSGGSTEEERRREYVPFAFWSEYCTCALPTGFRHAHKKSGTSAAVKRFTSGAFRCGNSIPLSLGEGGVHKNRRMHNYMPNRNMPAAFSVVFRAETVFFQHRTQNAAVLRIFPCGNMRICIRILRKIPIFSTKRIIFTEYLENRCILHFSTNIAFFRCVFFMLYCMRI